MVVKVNWAVWDSYSEAQGASGGNTSLQILCYPPENAYAYLKTIKKDTPYLKCYALIDTLKNAYIIRAPLDLHITFNKEKNWLSVDGVSQAVYDKNFLNRTRAGIDAIPTVSMLPRYVFYSDTSVEMLSLTPLIIGGVNNTTHIPGKFNIGKWVRPLDWTFEIVNHEEPVVVKRGDPLFMVIFTTPDNDKVELNRVPYTQELNSVSAVCTGLKRMVTNTPLHKCYEMAESFLAAWRKHRGKM